MKKFNKIAVINKIRINDDSKDKIQQYSEEKIVYSETDSDDENEICERIGNADAVLGNFHTKITSSILEQTPNIKYIGICGTSLTNIDLEAIRKHNITITNISDYGDEATAEYIFSQLLNLIRGAGKHKFANESCELNSKTIGIIGLGAVGKKVAKVSLGFGMNVLYFSNSRKPEWEEKGIEYLPLEDLFKRSDILSISVPRDTQIIGKEEISNIGSNKIIVDTCLGNIYKDFDVVRMWLQNKNNFLIRDRQPEINNRLGDLDRFIYTENIIAGITKESRERMSEKVINNIESYFKNN